MNESAIVVFLILAISTAIVLVARGIPTAPNIPAPLAWYDDPTQSIHISTYPSVERATEAANNIAPLGWIVQSVTTDAGHVNLGRTVSGAVLTGGISLLLGGSRTKGSVTVTFTRS